MKTLTDNEWEVLSGLEYLRRNDLETRGHAPLDFGGSNGSHHGATAKRLADKGLVDRRYRGYDWGEPKKYRNRGSCVYRISDEGMRLFPELKAAYIAKSSDD